MPYQTLISSIIHKYAAGTLIDCRLLIVNEEPAPYKVSADKKKKQVPECWKTGLSNYRTVPGSGKQEA